MDITHIEKKATKQENQYWDIKYFSSARMAFQAMLKAYGEDGPFTLLLPMYIGISPKEGSGIYDPVCTLGIKHVFYRFGARLEIDLKDVQEQLQKIPGRKAFLLVHYFGYVDPAYQQLLTLLKEQDVLVIEDCAHALYTHLVDGKCGQSGCVFYSFHKMLPFAAGGAAATTRTDWPWWKRFSSQQEAYPYYQYHWKHIADKRKQNALYWEQLLQEDMRIELLRPSSHYHGQTPQSLPILLKRADRYSVYLELNRLGYGTISLYHTMIPPISKINDETIRQISSSILNLPVHQDIGEKEIKEMYSILVTLLG